MKQNKLIEGHIMDPIKFVGYNEVYAENQPEYIPLPVFKESNGKVTSVWELTDDERRKIADGAMISLRVNTFNEPLQPLQLWVDDIAKKVSVNYTEKDIFCNHQLIGSGEDEGKLLCCAHLAESRCFVCRFKNLKEAKTRNANGGCCEDATEPKNDGKDY